MTTQAQYREAQQYIQMLQERLTAAFEAMRTTGRIVAEEDFCDCQSCGLGGVEDIRENEVAYVFYHNQDTEAMLEDGEVYLSYGTFDGNEYRQIAIGRIVSGYLQEAGLAVEWDGLPKTRILVRLNEVN